MSDIDTTNDTHEVDERDKLIAEFAEKERVLLARIEALSQNPDKKAHDEALEKFLSEMETRIAALPEDLIIKLRDSVPSKRVANAVVEGVGKASGAPTTYTYRHARTGKVHHSTEKHSPVSLRWFGLSQVEDN